MEKDVFRDFDELEPKLWILEVTFKAPDIFVFDDQISDRIMDRADELDLCPSFSIDRQESEVALCTYVDGTLRQAAYKGLETTLSIFESVGVHDLVPIKATLLEEDGEVKSVSSGEYDEDEIAEEILAAIHDALQGGADEEDMVELDLTQTVLAMYAEIRQFGSSDK